jgi:bifunctional non-homologous end joining protein LigD
VPALAELEGTRRGRLPATVSPQLATLADRVPEGPGWLHEPKLDGYRLLCRIDHGRVTLLTRRGNDWTNRFPALAQSARMLRCDSALLDGEAVIFDAHGVSDFQALQAAIGRQDPAIEFVAFDLLHLNGWDLRRAALIDRKRQLERLLGDAPALIGYGQHIEGRGAAFYAEACRIGLEGVVTKRAADGYREKRTRSWLKIKCTRRQEFVVVGFTDPQGSRAGFGALLLATRDETGGPLRYAGKVGTGFDNPLLHSLRERLDALACERSPLPQRPAGLGRVHWVAPELVAEVAFTEWTGEGALRHPTFKGLREDKPADEVVAEHAAASAASTGRAMPPQARRVRLTNPDRVLYPETGITKRQLAGYWTQVAPVALAHLRHRPLTLLRCPEGRDATCFYQMHVGAGTPDAIARVHIREEEDPYAMVDALPAILGLVQIGTLELHVWGSRAEHIEQPDLIVFDLDPSEELPWSAVVEAALELRERIEALGLVGFVRVTGGKGLHVVVPVVPGPKWPSVKRFAHALVNEMVRDAPARYTGTLSKRRRVGKIFIDYLRNARGATAIASYSPRARPGAPVALPVDWASLDASAPAPPRYALPEVPALVARRADPWAGFEDARRPLV